MRKQLPASIAKSLTKTRFSSRCALPKERVEIFGAGKVFLLDDFRSAITYQNGRRRTTKLRNQDKGQANEVRAVCEVVLKGGPAPIALADLAATSRATFGIRESLRSGLPVEVK